MSSLEELVRYYCPNGIETKLLGDLEDEGILTLGRGEIISKKEIQANSGVYPVYSSSAVGDGQIGSYGKYMFDDERITWSIDGGGKIFYRNNIKYSVTNVGGWLKVNKSDILSTKYLYYCLINQWITKSFDYTRKAHPSVIRNEYSVPMLPLTVQNKIVHILDTFTGLISELTTELTARKKQYEYYRKLLLNFDGQQDIPFRWTTIEQICNKVSSGGTPSTSIKDYYEGNIPWLRTQEVDFLDIYDTGVKITEEGVRNSSANWIPANCIIVAMYGATAAKVAINKIPLTTNQACCNLQIDEEKAMYKYVFHWLSSQYLKLKALGQGSQSNINAKTVKNFPVPVPSVEEQERIVAILDRFDTLCNDLTSGLPAEIEARKKQYEYYRDKLLTFKEASV